MRRRLAILTAALAAALASAGTAGATTFYLSFASGEPPITNTGGDVGGYEDSPPPGSATGVVFSETLFVDYPNDDVDAFELLPSGNMILSVTNPASLLSDPTVIFEDGDLFEYDPFNNTATVYFLESSLNATGNPDIDAVAVLPNGDLLLSTLGQHDVPGIGTVEDGDIIRWDGTSASLFLDEDLFFGVDVDIDAFDVASDGDYAFSLETPTNILGLGVVDDGDLVRWDISTNTASIWLDESVFTGGAVNIDAVAVPEPGSSALFALGLVGLAVAGRRRPR